MFCIFFIFYKTAIFNYIDFTEMEKKRLYRNVLFSTFSTVTDIYLFEVFIACFEFKRMFCNSGNFTLGS